MISLLSADSNVLEAFATARELILYVFRVGFAFLNSNSLTRALLYTFIIGILLSVVFMLRGSND